MAELEAEARLHYTGTLFLARDFDTYELDATGKLSKLAAADGRVRVAASH